MSKFARRAGPFGKLIESRRRQLQLTREELAGLVGLSADYLADLETRGTKRPRLEKLANIARIVACYSRDQAKKADVARGKPTWDEVNREVALEVMLLAMRVEVPDLFKNLGMIDFVKEIAEQHQEPEESEIWIISDILAEAIDPGTASKTADNIRDKRIRYRFFVPNSSADVHWRTAVDHIREALGTDGSRVHEHVSVYKLSDCAFACRLRIAGIGAPDSVQPSGRYTILGSGARDARLVNAPPALVANITTLLWTLCHRADAGPYEDPAVGAISKVFPQSEPRRGEK